MATPTKTQFASHILTAVSGLFDSDNDNYVGELTDENVEAYLTGFLMAFSLTIHNSVAGEPDMLDTLAIATKLAFQHISSDDE